MRFRDYRGTSFRTNFLLPGSYSRHVPSALRWSHADMEGMHFPSVSVLCGMNLSGVSGLGLGFRA